MGNIEKANKDEHEGSYAGMNPHAKYYNIEKHNAMVLSKLPKNLKGKKVLELGFGQGGLLVSIMERGGEAHGIDIANSAKKLLEKKFAIAALNGKKSAMIEHPPKVKIFALTDTLPYASDTFDAVIALHVVEHIQDEHAILREVRRVLKSGGVFLMAVPRVPEGSELDRRKFHTEFHYREYSRKSLHHALRNAGFSGIKIRAYQSFYDFIAGFLANELPGKLLKKKHSGTHAKARNEENGMMQEKIPLDPPFILKLQGAFISLAVALESLDRTTAWFKSDALFAEAWKK